MNKRGGLVIALVALGAAALASTAGAGSSSADRLAAVDCSKTITLPILTPLTGGGGPIGNEQLSWAKYAAKTLGPRLKLKVQIVGGDTPVEKGPGEALKVAQKFISNSQVAAVIGPATSGGVASASTALAKAGLLHVSPSATDTALAAGPKAKRSASPAAFFRVVGGDYVQGPTDANFMVSKLKAKKVVVVDFQEPYSLGLARAANATLKAKGVQTVRLSTSVDTTDFSSLVTKVPNDANVVFFPTQQPEDAQTFGQQLLEQGKRAKMFGADGTNNPAAFKIPGSYLSNFAPDISGIKGNAARIAGWKKDNPKANLGSFGPPTYLATQVAMMAIAKACNAGGGTLQNRAAVLKHVRGTVVPNSILGGTFRFSRSNNEPVNPKFYIFQIQKNGSYKLVG
ncbi:MAG: branched-chain amino acid ABC transporter substrate-binding protein [Gaiella sp.]|nr:branched-chain amino acid ABC transporter substrate-binding protein [Gaiella sp.]